MSGYTVFTMADEEGHLGSGLTLSEAFARIMALAHCDYVFRRSQGEMLLSLMHHDGLLREHISSPAMREQYFPDFRSKLVDDQMARMEIMREFLRYGFKGYHIVTDEYWRQEDAKCIADELRPRQDQQRR